ncbi:PocR ligand-binding domain-containing protein [Megalodesulfovibrio paquesii]
MPIHDQPMAPADSPEQAAPATLPAGLPLCEASQLRAMLATIPDLVWLKDVNGVYLYANAAFETFVGRSEAQILGRTDHDLFDPTLADFFQVRDRLALQADKATHNEEMLTFAGVDRQGIFETVKTPMRNAEGRVIGVLGVARDVTARKRAEEALERRMMALTRPLGEVGEIAIEELFRLEDLQRLQDEFSRATGVASLITRPDGTPITRPSNFCKFCIEIVRNSPKGRQNCKVSDSLLGRASTEGPRIQRCLSGGLWDAGAGITVGGLHIGNWLIGQARDDSLTEAQLRQYAREIEVDEEELLRAYQDVPVMSLERFRDVAQVLYTLANQLSDIAYQNVQQARAITALKQAEAQLRGNDLYLRSLVRVLQHEGREPATILALALDAGMACSGSTLGYAECVGLTDLPEPDACRPCLPLALPAEARRLARSAAWQQAVAQNAPVLDNAPEACIAEQSATPATRILVVPVQSDGQLIARVALGGKASDYDDADILRLSLLVDSAWKVLKQRLSAEALRNARDDLERQVEERTRDLAQQARELETANQALRDLGEMKSTLMNTVSHELRTPLTAMYGFIHLIRKEFTTHVERVCHEPADLARRCARIKENLDIIESEGRRLGRIINDFLDLSKIESGRMAWNDTRVSPETLVTRAVRLVRPRFEAKGEVALSVGPMPRAPCLLLDEDRLVQVLVNLLDNACKNTRQGSVALSATQKDGTLHITVADTGRGIPETELERVFETFYQSPREPNSDEPVRGTGLGLAICRQIVSHYGGRIWASAHVDKAGNPVGGAVFHVVLPMQEGGETTSCGAT